MTDCLCNVGYTGPDGGLCTACPAGTFKAIDGSGECVLCDAGTFQAATAATTASACLPCVPPDDSDPGSAECYTGDGLPRICYNRTLSLEEVCPARDVVVSGCAVGDVEFEIDVLQASESRVDLGFISSQCSAFYTWICEALGGIVGDVMYCDFYCEFWQSVSAELSGGCGEGVSEGEECSQTRATLFGLQPAPGTFCADHARYALYSSCIVPGSKQQAFAEAVDALVQPAHDSGLCEASALAEELHVEDSGVVPTPENAAPNPDGSPVNFDCFEKTDCRFACFNHGFAIAYSGTAASLTTAYQGSQCDCSVKGFFVGTVQLGGDMSIAASNGLNDTLTMKPVVAFNQIVLAVNSSDGYCSFAPNFAQGSLMGLPTEAPLRPSTKGELDFAGYDASLSAAPALASSAPQNASAARRRLTQATGDACPQETGDCRYECLSSGLESEAYGTSLILRSKHEGDCDCGQVFVPKSGTGVPILHGEVYLTDSGDLGFTYANAFYPSFAPSATVGASGFLDGDLAPLEGESLLLKVGGACAYRMGVAAGTLSMIREALAERIAAANALQVASITLTGSNLGTSCPNVPDCKYTCLFSGLTKVTTDLAIVGASPDQGCSCKTYRPAVNGNRIAVSDGIGGWSIEADFAANALYYTYVTGAVNCSGHLNVSGGVFLGIPRSFVPGISITDNIEDENKTAWDGPDPVTVEEAERYSTSLTTIVASAVGVSVATTVAGAVATATTFSAAAGTAGGAGIGAGGGVASGASSGGASGASAISLITQAQTIALTARIGGPEAQPESTRALSNGLEWVNFHIIKVWGDRPEESDPAPRATNGEGEGDGGDNNGGSSGGGGSSGVESNGGDNNGFARNCIDAQHSSRELAGTILMAVISIAAASLVRTIVNALIRRMARAKGKELDGDAIPVLSWEVQVFLLQYQGLAESAGEAIASKCFGYEIAGFFVLLVLLLIAGTVLVLVFLAVRQRVIVWQKKSAKQAAIEMKDALKDSKGTGILHRLRVTYAAYIVLNDRGSWEANDTQPDKEEAGNNILDRVGSFFDGATGVAWWYGFWCLLRVMALGVILASFFTPEDNAVAALVLSVMDSFFLLISRPQVAWMGFIQETYKAMINLATLGAILSYVQGNLPVNWFSNVFVVLSAVSIVPAAIASVLGPVVGAINTYKACLSSCAGLCGSGNLGAASGTVMAITAVARDDDGFQDKVLEAIEKDQDPENEPNGNGQYDGNGQYQLNGNGQYNGNGTTMQHWQAPSVQGRAFGSLAYASPEGSSMQMDSGRGVQWSVPVRPQPR